jgi:hypothetical protein
MPQPVPLGPSRPAAKVPHRGGHCGTRLCRIPRQTQTVCFGAVLTGPSRALDPAEIDVGSDGTPQRTPDIGGASCRSVNAAIRSTVGLPRRPAISRMRAGCFPDRLSPSTKTAAGTIALPVLGCTGQGWPRNTTQIGRMSVTEKECWRAKNDHVLPYCRASLPAGCHVRPGPTSRRTGARRRRCRHWRAADDSPYAARRWRRHGWAEYADMFRPAGPALLHQSWGGRR